MQIQPPSKLEQASGSLITEVALTAIGAAAGGVLAPLLPVLGKSLAAERQRKRVESTLRVIAEELERQSEVVNALSDGQYQLINEVVLSALQTTQSEKLDYLRYVVSNTLRHGEIPPEEASVLSRIIRDISALEATFLVRNFAYAGLALTHLPQPPEQQEDNLRHIPPDSPDALSVGGLVALGVLYTGEPTWDIAPLRFSRIVAKLIVLLTKPDA